MIERQELHCHNCLNYVQFDADLSCDANMVLTCPICGHEHCRVIKDGQITSERWDSRNVSDSAICTVLVNTMNISATSVSTFQTYNSAYQMQGAISNNSNQSTASPFLYMSWMNATSVNASVLTQVV